MRTIKQPGSQGSNAFNHGLMVAAHLSMSSKPRVEIWVTPTQGPGRKLTEADPLYSNATKELRKAGDLKAGETARWSDGSGNNFVARRA